MQSNNTKFHGKPEASAPTRYGSLFHPSVDVHPNFPMLPRLFLVSEFYTIFFNFMLPIDVILSISSLVLLFSSSSSLLRVVVVVAVVVLNGIGKHGMYSFSYFL